MLTVLEKVDRDKRHFLKCICDCGEETISREYEVVAGKCHSCGCYQREKARNNKNRETHGLTLSPEYGSWCKMKSRCYNKNNSRYYRYGERGIIVCERWINSFENFYEDMGNKPGEDYSIDRINNDGNYEKSNCRWATPKQQANNQSYHGGKGVSFRDNLFISQLGRKGMRIYLGQFKTFSEAEEMSNKFKIWFDENEEYILLNFLKSNEVVSLFREWIKISK